MAIGAAFLYSNPVEDSTSGLKEYDFINFTMLVPKDADFSEYDSVGKGTSTWAIGYSSNDNAELSTVWVGNYKPSNIMYDYIEKDGDLEIYSGAYNSHVIERNVGGYDIQIVGTADLDKLKEMANSIKVTHPLETTSTQSTTSAAPTSATPSSISILGGSFSTGSADADKTYARINVGTSHAGEEVIVQIFYSRDGNSLNNGNMVPATVHSDGYLEIASADAYKYYPDHATVKIYDKNSKLLTTKEVYLSPTSGTQTF